MREWGGEGQCTSNLGPGWTRIAPHKEEGFQVSKRDLGERGKGESARGIGKGSQQWGLTRGCAMALYR